MRAKSFNPGVHTILHIDKKKERKREENKKRKKEKERERKKEERTRVTIETIKNSGRK